MFDQLELPADLCYFMASISPLLGISGEIEDYDLHVLTRYFPVDHNHLIIAFPKNGIPEELSLNLLRKGEDRLLIAAYNEEQLDRKTLKTGKKIASPTYIHSVVSFEAKLLKILNYDGNDTLAIYEVLRALGVAGIDPGFNDKVTIAKTIEIMSLTAVDKLVIEKKVQNKNEW